MKVLLSFIFIISTAFAQDPEAYLKNFDAKVYSLKTKGVKEFVVDIESSKLTKQMNDQQIFGKVNELVFRTYWTANPERLAIEVIGLPDGFKEVKEELKATIFGIIDNVIPKTIGQRFSGYKISAGNKAKEFIAKDTSGVAAVPGFLLKFDNQDRLVEIQGLKPIGSLSVTSTYEKEAFSDGRWVLKKQITTSTESGQSIVIKKDLSYGQEDGIGVLKEVDISTEQKSLLSNSKAVSVSESISFKNYKINSGEAMKYFLGDAQQENKKIPAKTR